MSYSKSLELIGSSEAAEERVIDHYFVSLQNGEMDSRHPMKSAKQQPDELLEELKKNLNDDLDKIAAQINSSGKAKWRNSTKTVANQQSNMHDLWSRVLEIIEIFKDKHIRFSSSSGDEQVNGEELQNGNADQPLKQSPTKKPQSKDKPKQNKRDLTQNGRKEFDFGQLEPLNGAPRLSERIAFQVSV